MVAGLKALSLPGKGNMNSQQDALSPHDVPCDTGGLKPLPSLEAVHLQVFRSMATVSSSIHRYQPHLLLHGLSMAALLVAARL